VRSCGRVYIVVLDLFRRQFSGGDRSRRRRDSHPRLHHQPRLSYPTSCAFSGPMSFFHVSVFTVTTLIIRKICFPHVLSFRKLTERRGVDVQKLYTSRTHNGIVYNDKLVVNCKDFRSHIPAKFVCIAIIYF